jgi:ferredoxin
LLKKFRIHLRFVSTSFKENVKMSAKVDKEKCAGCEVCVGVCPVEAISMVDGAAQVGDACIDCGACVGECPAEAISLD